MHETRNKNINQIHIIDSNIGSNSKIRASLNCNFLEVIITVNLKYYIPLNNHVNT